MAGSFNSEEFSSAYDIGGIVPPAPSTLNHEGKLLPVYVFECILPCCKTAYITGYKVDTYYLKHGEKFTCSGPEATYMESHYANTVPPIIRIIDRFPPQE